MSFLNSQRVVATVVGVAMTMSVSAEAFAGPMSMPQVGGLGASSQITDVKYVPRKVVRRRGGGGNAAAAAMIGIMGLAIGSAIANSQREERYAPAPFYRRPRYGYEQEPVYVQPRQVYVQPQPVYEQPRPVYVQPQPTYVAPRPVFRQEAREAFGQRREEFRRDFGRGPRGNFNRGE